MLVKLTAGLNFINVLRTAFTHVEPECASQQCHLALLGPTSVKAACKTLVILTPYNGYGPITYTAR